MSDVCVLGKLNGFLLYYFLDSLSSSFLVQKPSRKMIHLKLKHETDFSIVRLSVLLFSSTQIFIVYKYSHMAMACRMVSWVQVTKKLDDSSNILQFKYYFVLVLLGKGIAGLKSRYDLDNLLYWNNCTYFLSCTSLYSHREVLISVQKSYLTCLIWFMFSGSWDNLHSSSENCYCGF